VFEDESFEVFFVGLGGNEKNYEAIIGMAVIFFVDSHSLSILALPGIVVSN
jgi:hypothetical protein